jgi:hypothetical protein
VALPPKEAVTVEVGTLAQTSEPPLGDGAAEEVAVGFADPPAGGDAEGDVEEQPASKISRAATAAAAAALLLAPPLGRRRNRINTVVADSRRAGSPCQGG